MEEVPEFYANNVRVLTSLYDVSLAFNVQNLPESADDTRQHKPVCIVRMSPQHAKSLAQILVQHVKRYEEDQGVSLPTSVPYALDL